MTCHYFFFFSSRRRHTRCSRDWSSDVCSSDLVMGKADSAFSRTAKLEDTTIGWRFVNPLMKAKYGTDSMPETGEIVAEEFHISRQDQDLFALRSQQRTADAKRACRLSQEITPVPVPQKKGDPLLFSEDEHPRPDTTLEALAKLKPIVKADGRSEEHTSELQSRLHLVCRLLLEKKTT